MPPRKKNSEASEKAAEYCQQGRETLRGVGSACEHFVRERPLNPS